VHLERPDARIGIVDVAAGRVEQRRPLAASGSPIKITIGDAAVIPEIFGLVILLV
jgi:hypothetical protein